MRAAPQHLGTADRGAHRSRAVVCQPQLPHLGAKSFDVGHQWVSGPAAHRSPTSGRRRLVEPPRQPPASRSQARCATVSPSASISSNLRAAGEQGPSPRAVHWSHPAMQLPDDVELPPVVLAQLLHTCRPRKTPGAMAAPACRARQRSSRSSDSNHSASGLASGSLALTSTLELMRGSSWSPEIKQAVLGTVQAGVLRRMALADQHLPAARTDGEHVAAAQLPECGAAAA